MFVLFVSCHTATKSPTSTNITFQWGNENYGLHATSATLENNRLNIYIEEKPNPDERSNYAIEILQANGTFEVSMKRPWGITDSSSMPPRFEILDQKIKLNKDEYKVGDTLRGELQLLVAAHRAYIRNPGEMMLRNDWDTLKVEGVFGSMVKRDKDLFDN